MKRYLTAVVLSLLLITPTGLAATENAKQKESKKFGASLSREAGHKKGRVPFVWFWWWPGNWYFEIYFEIDDGTSGTINGETGDFNGYGEEWPS